MWHEQLRPQKTNKIQRLYPTCKFIIVCLYSVCSLMLSTIKIGGYPLLIIPFFFIIPLLCLASGVLKDFVKAFTKIAFVVTFIFVVQCLFVRGGETLWQWTVLKVDYQGLKTGLTLAFSISNISGIFIWLFKTTTNEEIARALENGGMNHKAAYVFLSTLQMVEVMSKSSQTIMNAQRARGVETDGNLVVRAKAFFPTLVPLILSSIISMEERVLTLESKGFDIQGEKTYLFQVYPSGDERFAVIIAGAIALVLTAGRIMLWVL